MTTVRDRVLLAKRFFVVYRIPRNSGSSRSSAAEKWKYMLPEFDGPCNALRFSILLTKQKSQRDLSQRFMTWTTDIENGIY